MGDADLEGVTNFVAPDRPISKFSQDKLDRERFVERICNALISEKTGLSTGVVIGITGPWGSGKSSILNLLHAFILRDKKYPNAVVVRFDPWLISSRENLIGQFFAELVATINQQLSINKALRMLSSRLLEYGAYFSPLADIYGPGFSGLALGGLKAARKALKQDKGINVQRRQLLEQLSKVKVPIIVIIDELDRVEDEEVRAIAQLVRSVADFPEVSYVLAYDADRVIEALGTGERGRAYLEKIVQFPFPLPITLEEELLRLLYAEIEPLQADISIPKNWRENERFGLLVNILIPDLISTPRDIKRLIGTFHVLAGMAGEDVDWIDVFGFSTLLVKAPGTVEKIKARPDWVVVDPLNINAQMASMADDKLSVNERIELFCPIEERSEAMTKLLGQLFPKFDDGNVDRIPRAENIYHRRSLLTVLRFGLIPGMYARSSIIEFLALPRPKIEEQLRNVLEDGTFPAFFDRLDDVYAELEDVDHLCFWLAVGRFLEKPDSEWLSTFSAKQEISRNFANLFKRSLKNNRFYEQAKYIFQELQAHGATAPPAYLIRSHIFSHGLFGHKNRDRDQIFLTAEETEEIAKQDSSRYRQAHLEGNWISSLWDLQPVFTMIDTGHWDDKCRKRMDELLEEDAALEGFTLMLFGSYFTTDRPTVEKLVTFDDYRSKLEKRLNDPSIEEADESVRFSLQKAFGNEF